MNILLVCNAGMSTGIMEEKLKDELKLRGMSGKVSAVPLIEIDDYLSDYEIILLGPQIRFAYDELLPKTTNKLLMVIPPQDFGSMNAKKVLDDILKKIKE